MLSKVTSDLGEFFMKRVLFVTILALTPSLGFAMCTGHEQTAQSCADGYAWDGEKGQCVQQVTG